MVHAKVADPSGVRKFHRAGMKSMEALRVDRGSEAWQEVRVTMTDVSPGEEVALHGETAGCVVSSWQQLAGMAGTRLVNMEEILAAGLMTQGPAPQKTKGDTLIDATCSASTLCRTTPQLLVSEVPRSPSNAPRSLRMPRKLFRHASSSSPIP